MRQIQNSSREVDASKFSNFVGRHHPNSPVGETDQQHLWRHDFKNKEKSEKDIIHKNKLLQSSLIATD
jgi:hypothetical protein